MNPEREAIHNLLAHVTTLFIQSRRALPQLITVAPDIFDFLYEDNEYNDEFVFHGIEVIEDPELPEGAAVPHWLH